MKIKLLLCENKHPFLLAAGLCRCSTAALTVVQVKLTQHLFELRTLGHAFICGSLNYSLFI
jgi:hypothetical protein